jgi:hypothetical protein
MDIRTLIETLRKELPPTFARQSVKRWLNGYLSPGHLANLNSQGGGPRFIYVGKRAVYERNDFLEWFESYIQSKSMYAPKGIGGKK